MQRRFWMKAWVAGVSAMCSALLLGHAAQAADNEIRIAYITGKTGTFEYYYKQASAGFYLGLDYATGGTMTVAGKKIVVKEYDDQNKPDVGKSLLASAYGDDKADLAVGTINSAITMAMEPVAEEYKKLLMVDVAVADPITGAAWNKYVFRVARNSSQDAIASAIAVDAPNVNVAFLAQDYAFGKSGVAAFKQWMKQAKVVHEEYLPPATTDYTAGIQRIVDALKDKPGRKLLVVTWAGANQPYGALADADLKKRFGIEVSTSPAQPLVPMADFKRFPGMEGAGYYFYTLPKNPINDWMVKEHMKRYNGMPPDFFTPGGFATAQAIVEALKKTNGDASSSKLIPVLEGMTWDTPKGKMTLRKEDHQAMQEMYIARITSDQSKPWAVPELVRVIKPEEINVPITNNR